MPAARVTAPQTSCPLSCPAPAALSRGMYFRPRSTTATATGTETRKVQRQLMAGHQASDDQPEREAAGAERGEDGDSPVAFAALGEVGGDDGEAGGSGERGGQALEEAGGDQQGGVIHQAAQQGSGGEDAERDQEDAPPAEQVRHPAAQQEQASVAEHVGGDDPLEGFGSQVEFGADRGQGHAHHGHVQPVEGQNGAHDHQQHPLRTGPADGRKPFAGRSFKGGR